MGKDLKGKELGVGLNQRKDGRYQARFTKKDGKRAEKNFDKITEAREWLSKEKYLDNNNTVMAHIGRLREKLNEPAKNPKFIKTVWGVGYEIE